MELVMELVLVRVLELVRVQVPELELELVKAIQVQ